MTAQFFTMQPTITSEPRCGEAAQRGDVPDPPSRACFHRLLVGNVLHIIAVLAIAALVLHHSRQVHDQRAVMDAQNLAARLSQKITMMVDRTDSALQAVVFEVGRYNDGIDVRDLNRFLAQRQWLIPELLRLRVADGKGDILATAGKLGNGAGNVADQDFFQRTRDNPRSELVVAGPVPSPVDGRPAIVLSRRLHLGDGSFAGIAFSIVGSGYFQPILLNLPSRDGFSLFTSDGHALVRYAQAGREEATVPGDEDNVPLQQAIQASPEGGVFLSRNPLGEITGTVAYAKVAPYALYVVTEVAIGNYLETWAGTIAKVAGGVAFAILGALILSWLAYQQRKRQAGEIHTLARENRRHRLLQNASGEGIHVLDRNGNLLEVNDSFCALLGYSREELVGRNIANLDAMSSPAEVAAFFQTLPWGRRTFETRHRRKDGSLIDVEISAGGAHVDGQFLIYAAARDVTARKRAEAERLRLAQELELLEAANQIILRADQEHQLISDICRLLVNRGRYAVAWFGYADATVPGGARVAAGAGCAELTLADPGLAWAEGAAATAIKSGRPWLQPDLRIGPADAPWRQAALDLGCEACLCLPLLGDEEMPAALNVYAGRPGAFGPEEIRFLEKLAGNLGLGIKALRDRGRLADSQQALQAFTYAASHDLKAPLRGISSFSGLLEVRYRDRLDGDGLLFLQQIRRGALRMAALLDQLLAYSRVKQDIRHVQTLAPATVIDQVLAERDQEIRQRGARVHVGLSPALVRADPGGLAQVLRNLLANALLYAAPIEPPVVEIGGETRGCHYRLWVRDKGTGFDMVYHDRIFEIFRRLHTYDEFPGAGVGLALARKAMEGMEGRIWAESAPGEGAVFFLELPLAAEQEVEIRALAVA